MSTATTIESRLLGLRRIPLLKTLPDDALRQFALCCQWRQFKSGEVIFTRAADDRDVYLIVAGRVRIDVFSAAGRQITYRELTGGEWFGELAAFDGQRRSADALARDDTLIAIVTAGRFRDLLFEHRAAGELVYVKLASWVRDLSERVFALTTLGVQNRLHGEILRLARESGIKNNRALIAPMPTHAELAGRLSTSREQVTRELKALRAQGLLEGSGRSVVVKDVARLEAVVATLHRTT